MRDFFLARRDQILRRFVEGAFGVVWDDAGTLFVCEVEGVIGGKRQDRGRFFGEGGREFDATLLYFADLSYLYQLDALSIVLFHLHGHFLVIT